MLAMTRRIVGCVWLLFCHRCNGEIGFAVPKNTYVAGRPAHPHATASRVGGFWPCHTAGRRTEKRAPSALAGQPPAAGAMRFSTVIRPA
jgi:hypothetical protein